MFKVGIGYDVHRLVAERDLIIGGVKIDYEMGLLGHSDADVLTHAVMDALLGAAGQGDIGRHFPDSDTKYKGISSMELLEEVKNIIMQKGYAISNIDCVIVAQAPKMAGHIKQMEQNISGCLGGVAVNVKATTEEGLGFTGTGQGIAAKAVVLLYSEVI